MDHRHQHSTLSLVMVIWMIGIIATMIIALGHLGGMVATDRLPRRLVGVVTGRLPRLTGVATGRLPHRLTGVVTGRLLRLTGVATGRLPRPTGVATGRLPRPTGVATGRRNGRMAHLSPVVVMVVPSPAVVAQEMNEVFDWPILLKSAGFFMKRGEKATGLSPLSAFAHVH